MHRVKKNRKLFCGRKVRTVEMDIERLTVQGYISVHVNHYFVGSNSSIHIRMIFLNHTRLWSLSYVWNVKHTYTTIELHINGNKLPEVCAVKDLDITYDSNPSSILFLLHSLRVNLLFRSFLTRNRTVLAKACITYARAILEYGSEVWSEAYKAEKKSRYHFS